MYKHYARVLNGIVVKFFSDAFETPASNDICINKNGARQCDLNAIDSDGLYIYKADRNKIVERDLSIEKLSLIKNRKLTNLEDAYRSFIYSFYPQETQLKYTFRFQELQEKQLAGFALTEIEKAEKLSLQEKYKWYKSVKDKHQIDKDNILKLNTIESINNYKLFIHNEETKVEVYPKDYTEKTNEDGFKYIKITAGLVTDISNDEKPGYFLSRANFLYLGLETKYLLFDYSRFLTDEELLAKNIYFDKKGLYSNGTEFYTIINLNENPKIGFYLINSMPDLAYDEWVTDKFVRNDEKYKVVLIRKIRDSINNQTDIDIKSGCEYEGFLLPISDEWEAKYIGIEKSYSEGRVAPIVIDDVNNKPFTITIDNIGNLTDVLFSYKLKLILTAQAIKRSLDTKTIEDLEKWASSL